jgi:hypothetical protein
MDLYLLKRSPLLSTTVKEFAVEFIPYYVIIDVLFWLSILLSTTGFLGRFTVWSHANLPGYLYYVLYGLFGQLMFVYYILSWTATCNLFISYRDCSSMYAGTYSLTSREYINFIFALANVVLPLVVVMKVFSLRDLLRRRKVG